MLGTIVNTLTIVVGSLLGVLLRKGLPERLRNVVMQGLGLCVILIGLRGAIKTENEMIVILSVVLGGVLGALIGIEKRLDAFGARIQARFQKMGGGSDIGKGFVTATLIFCVGSMAIVGSMDAGLRGNYATLLAKSVLDGVTSLILASTLGIGVILSAVAVFVYQGAITLLSRLIAPLFTDRVILEMSAVGGLLIMGIGINMLREKHLPVGDLLPAIFLPPLFLLVMS